MIKNTWRSAHDTNKGMSFERSTEEAKICKHKLKDQESLQINWSGFRLRETKLHPAHERNARIFAWASSGKHCFCRQVDPVRFWSMCELSSSRAPCRLAYAFIHLCQQNYIPLEVPTKCCELIFHVTDAHTFFPSLIRTGRCRDGIPHLCRNVKLIHDYVVFVSVSVKLWWKDEQPGETDDCLTSVSC